MSKDLSSPASAAETKAGDASSAPAIACVLGTMTFGWERASGNVDDAVSMQMLQAFAATSDACVEVDTAILYSAGETEKIIGRVMPKVAGGERLQVAIKANPWAGGHGGAGGLEPSRLRAQVEESLASLKVASVQLLYLHAPDTETPLVDSLRMVHELHTEGKFVDFGLSNFSAWETTHAWHLCAENGWYVERERERQRETERDRERERIERQTDRQTDRQTEQNRSRAFS